MRELPAWSNVCIDQVAAVPELAVRLEAVVVGPKVAAVGDTSFTSRSALSSVAFQASVTGTAVITRFAILVT
ncbi:hypothetical protein [Streptomyces chartreusis]|uniref:hypothetical protein n=1 Tax=Streptomyces chartreusis TaxID=1969 RepID=UPI003999BA34